MSHYVAEALDIITNDGTGIPVTYSNSAIGLASDGHIVLVTDRPNIVSVSGALVTRTDWFKNILAKNSNDFLPSRSCDFVEFGGIEMVSGMTFSIINTAAFWKTLSDNGVYLGNCVVKYYRITSTDNSAWVFEQRWQGVIDDQPFNELTYTVTCADNSKAILQNVPIDAVDNIRFPQATSSNLDKPIPIAIGRVAYSPLVNVSGPGAKVTLNVINGVNYTVAAVLQWNAATTYQLGLYYNGVTWAATDDTRLIGKYVTIISGGTAQSRKILGTTVNAATNTLYLKIDAIFTDSNGAAETPTLWSIGNTGATVTYCEVSDYSSTNVASQSQILSVRKGPVGNSSLYTYDSSASAFADLSEAVGITSVTNIGSYSLPGLLVTAKGVDTSGNVNAWFKIIPSSAQLVQNPGGTTNLPAVGAALTNLIDLDDSSYYSMNGTPSNYTFKMTAFIPIAQLKKSFDNLYLLMDFSHSQTGGTQKMRIDLYVKPIDIYGRVLTIAAINPYTIKNSNLGSTPELIYTLPRSYFNLSTGSDTDFYAQYANLEITSVVANLKAGIAYNGIRLDFQANAESPVAGSYTLLFREIGFMGRKSINITTDQLYSTLYGEIFGSTWNGRKTSALPAFTIADALEKIIRDYNIAPIYWVASKAYSIGDKVRSIADNDHIYVCTVAGTAGANAAITGAANNGSGLIRITSAGHGMVTGNQITIAGVVGTTEANASWTITVISSSTYDLQASTFTNAYVSGGTVIVNFPTGAGATVSDGGVTWKEFQTIPIDTTTFDAMAAQRASWFVGRTLTEKKPTVDYVAELAKQGFFIVITGSTGKLKAKAWRENTTALATFDSSKIIPDTLIELKPTAMRRVANDITIKYDENPGSNGFNKQIAVTNVDKPVFPSSTELLTTGTNLGSFTITFVIDFIGNRYLQVDTSAAHGLTSGDYTTLTGNSDGFNYTLQPVSVTSTTQFIVNYALYSATGSSSSGTLYKNTTSTLKWQTYVTGILNYTTAKGIWNQCHNSFVLTKRVQKLNAADGECRWFIDPLAKDPGGNFIWSDTVTPTYDITNVADDHPAVFYAKNISEWTAWQKKQCIIEVIDTAAMSALEIGDPVYLNDAKLTNGSNLLGWIHEKTQLARTDKLPYRFRFGITLNPEQLNQCNRILDVNGSTNRILDTNAAANRVLDVPC